MKHFHSQESVAVPTTGEPDGTMLHMVVFRPRNSASRENLPRGFNKLAFRECMEHGRKLRHDDRHSDDATPCGSVADEDGLSRVVFTRELNTHVDGTGQVVHLANQVSDPAPEEKLIGSQSEDPELPTDPDRLQFTFGQVADAHDQFRNRDRA